MNTDATYALPPQSLPEDDGISLGELVNTV
ncbi:MAG: hypothetical protein RLZZ393_1381, partial [Pseudomonadota bacterium]